MPANRFYSAFDTETLASRRTADGEYRNAFQIDRDRIIHSSAFRDVTNWGKEQILSGRPQHKIYKS